MHTNEYGEMYRLESFYWWFVARRKLLKWVVDGVASRFERPRILDVGCGTGINSTLLAEYGETVSCDVSPEAMEYCKKRGVDKLALSRVETLSFVSDSFDVVVALDVLEHIEDDLAGMAELRRVMRDDGLLIITVPAYGFLWSEHDEALQHKRRYAAYELRNKLTRAGFEVQRITFYITLLFFPILAVRVLQNIFKQSTQPKTSHIILPGWVNSMLTGILGFERFFLRWINFPFGVSLVCVARKSAARP
jgi:SAM-dependent methyltransferase